MTKTTLDLSYGLRWVALTGCAADHFRNLLCTQKKKRVRNFDNVKTVTTLGIRRKGMFRKKIKKI